MPIWRPLPAIASRRLADGAGLALNPCPPCTIGIRRSLLFTIPYPAIDPVLVQLGPFAIRWYALAYITAILIGWTLVKRLVRKPGWTLDEAAVDDLLLYVTLGIILGGRIGYVLFYQGAYYLHHPLEVAALWHGGMSFHGGLLGVVTALLLFSRRRGVSFLDECDALATVTPLGLLLGRLANFINGELWGRPTDVPWAMVFPRADPAVPRHPSQLYEAALEGLVLFLIMQWCARTPRRLEDRGRLAGIFLTGYAVARIACEFFREPDVQLGFLAGGITMGQLLSLPMLLVGVGAILRARRARRAAGPVTP